MVKINLDEREAWVLTEMLDRCLSDHDSFLYLDDDGIEQHDTILESEAQELFTLLLKKRGF